MTEYTLIIGDKNYSSWSMRAWLLLRFLDVPFNLIEVHLYRPESRGAVESLGGETGLVPILKDGDFAVWDTLAIVEFMAERHGNVWPAEQWARARARSYLGELHSGFTALRNAMPVNTRGRHRVALRTLEVDTDIARVQSIWEKAAMNRWLFEDFGVADIFFAPVATRFRTYDIMLSGEAESYRRRLLQHPLVEEWCALGMAEIGTIPILELPHGPKDAK